MKNLSSDLGFNWSLSTFLLAQDLQKYLIKKADWVPLKELKSKGFNQLEWIDFPIFDFENALNYLILNSLILVKRDQIGQIQFLKSRLLDQFDRKVSYFEVLQSFFDFDVDPDIETIHFETQDGLFKADSDLDADLDQPYLCFYALEDNTFYFGDFLTGKWTQIDFSNPFLYQDKGSKIRSSEKAWADLVITVLLQDLGLTDLDINELPLVKGLHTFLVDYYERNHTEILDKRYHWEAVLE